MAIELPASPKVYTTTYDNFKGVDYTNDSTNVWRRRSPTGYNMLPDASGRPFKRHGWEIYISKEQILEWIKDAGAEPQDDDILITKLAWFELAGKDHIVIFTDAGVIFYNSIDGKTAVNTELSCYESYDRCFFFEGGGTSAFYIYGEYRVWKYSDSLTLTEVTDNVTVPVVIVGGSADGTGTVMRGFNMLGDKAIAQYQDTNLRLEISGTPTTVIGVLLPVNVKDAQISDVTVETSTGTGTWATVPIVTSDVALTSGKCKLHPSVTINGETRAWIEFYTAPTAQVTGEDYIRITFPTDETSSVVYDSTTQNDRTVTGNASLNGEVV